MAELVFRVKADYEEAIKLREELNRLESEMKKVDATTKDGQDQLAQLTKEYSETGDKLKSIAEKAAEAGYVMSNEFGAKLADAKKQVIDLSVELVNAQKELDRLKNSGKATPQQIQDAEKKISDLSEALVKAEENYKDYTDSANKAGKGTKSLTEYSSAYNTIMRMLPGPIRSVVGGFRSLSGAALKFIATPLGAALLAVSAAFKGVSYWLNNTTSGMLAKQKWTKTLADTTEKWADKLGIVTKRMKELSDATASGAAAQITAYRSLQRQWEQANGVLEKQKEVLKSDEWKKLGISISGVNDAEDVLVSKSKNVVEALMARARAAAMYQKIEKEIEEQIKREDTTKASNKRIEDTKSEYQKNEREQERIVETFRQAQRDFVPALGYSRDMKRGDDYYVTSSGEKVYRNNLSEQAWREAILRNNRALRLSHGKARQDVGFFGRLGDNGLLPADESYDILANLYEKELDLTKGRIENLDNQIKENNEILDSYLQDIIEQMGEADSLKGVANDILSNVGANGDTTAQDENTRAIEKKRLRDAEDVEIATTTARISAMKDGTEKTISQINLNKRKEEIAIRRAYDDLREKKIEEEKKAFESNPDNKNLTFTYDYNSDKYAPTVAEVKKFLAEKNAIEVNAAKATKDALFQEEEAMYSYLKEYGNYWEKRLATINHYNGLIERATTDGERKRLENEKKNELQLLDRDRTTFRGQSSDIRTQIDIMNSDTDAVLSKLNEEREKLRSALDAAIASGESQEHIDSIRKDIELNQENAAIVTSENALKVARLEKELADKYGTKADQVDALRRLLDAQSALIKDDKQRDIFKAGGKVQLALAQYGNWQDYDTYDKAVEAAQKVYDAKKAELELREDNLGLMNLETQHANDLLSIELKYNKDLSTIFGNVSRYTKEQLANAKAIAQATLKAGEVNGQALTPNQIKDIQEALNGIIDAESELPFRSGNNDLFGIIKNVQILNTKQKELANMTDTTSVAYKKLAEEIEQRKEQLSLDTVATSVGSLISSLQMVSDLIGQIGSNSNNRHLQETAKALSGVAEAAGSAMEAYSQGGPVAGVIALALSLGKQVISDVIAADAATEKATRSTEELYRTLRYIALDQELKDNLNSIFGSSFFQGVENAKSVIEKTGLSNMVDFILANDRANEYNHDNLKRQINDIEKLQDTLSGFRITTKYRASGFGGADYDTTTLAAIAKEAGMDLYDEYGNFNVELLQSILSTYDTLTEEEKNFINTAIADSEAYRDAIDKIKDALSSVFSNITSQLADATIDGLRSGATMGATEMRQILGGTIKDLEKQMVQGVYQRALVSYEDEIIKGVIENGWSTEQIAEKYDELVDVLLKVVPEATAAAAGFEEKMIQRGYNLDEMENTSGSNGAYQNISETTGSAIEGRLSALQISSETKSQYLSLLYENSQQMVMSIFNSVRIAEDIRTIQSDAYSALVDIRNNTATLVSYAKDSNEKITNIEVKTRNL